MRRIISMACVVLLAFTINMPITAHAKAKSVITSLKYSNVDAKRKTSFKLKLSKAAKTTAKVYTSKGKLVKTLKSNKKMKKGTNSFEWDWKDKKDNLVESGKYTLKVVANYKKKNYKKNVSFRINAYTLLYDLAPEKEDSCEKFTNSKTKDNMDINYGLAFNTDSSAVFNLNKKYKTFDGFLGIKKTEESKNYTYLKIFGDGELLYSSGVFTNTTDTVPISLNVENVEKLEFSCTFTLVGFFTKPPKPVLIDCKIS